MRAGHPRFQDGSPERASPLPPQPLPPGAPFAVYGAGARSA